MGETNVVRRFDCIGVSAPNLRVVQETTVHYSPRTLVQIKQGIGIGSESQLGYLAAVCLSVALSLLVFHKMRIPFATSLGCFEN